jgi:DNA invertase Pin-like site-specific DNA recombinase
LELVNIYYDEGTSGTSLKRRKGFNQMIADALDGKIDVILVKSVSRFARNTIDTLQTTIYLKLKGVPIFFEKENIDSMDHKSKVTPQFGQFTVTVDFFNVINSPSTPLVQTT